MSNNRESKQERNSVDRRTFLRASTASGLLASVSAGFIRETWGAEVFNSNRASGAIVPFSKDEYVARWARVQAAMTAAGYENLIVWQRSTSTYDKVGNVYWLTSFYSNGTGQGPLSADTDEPWTFAAVLIRKGREPELHIGLTKDEFDAARVVCGKLVIHQGHMAVKLAEYLRTEKIEGRVAVVGDDVYPGLFDRVLRSHTPQIEWVTEETLLEGPQMIKSPRELDAFRTAGALVTAALSSATEAMIAGERACEAAARAAAIIMRGGGGFHRISISHGPASQIPLSYDFYGYNMTAPSAGDLISIWIYGPIFAGYWMDPGRSTICGTRPPSAQKTLVERCAKLVSDMVKTITPSMTGREVGTRWAEIARKGNYLEELGDESAMFGHGLGTSFPAYVLATGAPDKGPFGFQILKGALKPGMVLTAEAFLSRPGVGAVGFENNFIVTETGTELLDKTPMVFW
jgi:Xaa-Pro dipeptidase